MGKDRFEIAIGFAGDAYDFSASSVLGRQVAGQAFLKAAVGAAGDSEMACHALTADQFSRFQELVRNWNQGGATHHIPYERPAELATFGTLFWPSPNFVNHAWRRSRHDPAGWSLLGVAHSLAGHQAMDVVTSYLTSPVQDFDALVCPSSAIRDTVTKLLDSQETYLRSALGANCIIRPQLPVIPLGVETEKFSPNQHARAAMRTRLGLSDTDIVVLTVGRFDHRTKAHHLPLLIALGRVCKKVPNVKLVMVGTATDAGQVNTITSDAQSVCPNLTVRIVLNPSQADKVDLYRAGDIFASLADNVQESFGLVPLEAMAVGLPCVVSDWNGYRDTVRDGIDGFRINTTIPVPELGNSLSDLHDAGVVQYPDYSGRAALSTVVDIVALTEALDRLCSDRNVRQSMGEQASSNTRQLFDWKHVIAQYQELAYSLEQLRHAAKARGLERIDRPARPSPYALFREHATDVIAGHQLVTLDDPHILDAIKLSSSAELQSISELAGDIVKIVKPDLYITVYDVINALGNHDRGRIVLCLLWMAKFGAIRIAKP